MNKQQLASKIWESANKMRSKIEAFDKIFDTLHIGLNKLGETSGARTKAIRDLIGLIKDIPMDEKQGYDVLGYIYEYLISKFASNAGKKAGECYLQCFSKVFNLETKMVA